MTQSELSTKNAGLLTSGQATEEVSTAGMFELHGGC